MRCFWVGASGAKKLCALGANGGASARPLSFTVRRPGSAPHAFARWLARNSPDGGIAAPPSGQLGFLLRRSHAHGGPCRGGRLCLAGTITFATAVSAILTPRFRWLWSIRAQGGERSLCFQLCDPSGRLADASADLL